MIANDRISVFHFPVAPPLVLTLCLMVFFVNIAVSGSTTEDSLQKALVNTKDTREKVEIYTALAMFVKNKSADSALLYLDKAEVLLKQINCLDCMGKIFLLKGELSNLKGNNDDAIHQFKIADSIFRKTEDKKGQAQALTWIGVVYSNNYTIGESIAERCRYYLKALGIAREINETSLLVALYNNLGTLYTDAKDYPTAIDYYYKSQVIFEQWNDSVNRAITYLNLGSIYINSGKYDTSRSYFEKAIPIFMAKKIQPLLLASLAGYAYSLLKEKRYDDAMAYADQALNYFMTSGIQDNTPLSKVALSDIYSLKGLVYYETGSNRLAKKYLLQGYQLLDSLEDYGRFRDIAEPLAMIYQKEGRPDSSIFIYQRILIKSDTSLNNQVTSFSKLFTAQMEYEQEIREQQLQLQFRKTIQKRNLMIFIGSGILLISFALILFLRLRLEQQKKKRVESEKKQAVLEKQQALLEKETADIKLESQTREMTVNVMNLIRKNELMLEYSNRLVFIGKNTQDKRTESEIMQLINSMEQNTNNDVWEEFELRFNQVHHNYYEHLLSRFPDLSPGDLKLCALLKLNLSTKEICELSGQRAATLDMARYRLRKKLGLSTQDNLITFLSQL